MNGLIGKIIGSVTGAGAAISGASLLVKIGIGVGVFVAGAIAYSAWRDSLVQEGVDKTIAEFAAGDAKRIEQARQFRGKMNDCRSIGREWDQTTGECVP